MPDDGDVLSELDLLLAGADVSMSPWAGEVYEPDYDLARRLLAVPISQGAAEEQMSGRVAKALDAWIAHELRRAGFPEGAVWPRDRRPRVLPADLAPVEALVADAMARLDEFEQRLRRFAENAFGHGVTASPPSLYRVRPAIAAIQAGLPGASRAEILGRFYVKQVDVAVSSWQHGPDLLVSSKTQFSSYLNNKNNRYEEAVGEATNLRDRYPRAAMGFAFLVRTNLYDERGAFAYLRNQLARLRKPDGPFDATMLLSAEWDDGTKTLKSVEDAAALLSGHRFFSDLIDAVLRNSPVDVFRNVRVKKQGEPIGGMPPPDDPFEQAIQGI